MTDWAMAAVIGPDAFMIATAFVAAGFLMVVMAIFQSFWEHSDQEKSAGDEWQESGFDRAARKYFHLYRIVPTRQWNVAEYIFEDELRRELGRYLGYDKKRGEIRYGGKSAGLLVQTGQSAGDGALVEERRHSLSVVIRDRSRLIAQVVRENTFPPLLYRLIWQRQSFLLSKSGWLPTSAGEIRRDGELIGRFRRPKTFYQKELVALRPDLPEELKICLCSAVLLR